MSTISKNEEPRENQDSIIVVSGLPRSGTSMMMRMVEAGGLPLLIDNIRTPDDDNPKGYYEYERVKSLEKDSSWLDLSKGKGVKIISYLLRHLPNDKSYKILFMRRNMQEILSSQKVMLERLKRDTTDDPDDVKMADDFKKHLDELDRWLPEQKNIVVLNINYNDVITNSGREANRVKEFLGKQLDVEAMSSAVEKGLYRNRASSSSSDRASSSSNGRSSLRERLKKLKYL